MSKADKLFEELGYRKQQYQEGPGYELKVFNAKIVFNNREKLVYYDVNTKLIDLKTHTAINEKIKELGWLDE